MGSLTVCVGALFPFSRSSVGVILHEVLVVATTVESRKAGNSLDFAN